MENFDSLISKLSEITNKKSYNIKDFKYTKHSFNITLSVDEYNKIHHGDIIIMNHQSKQYRRFIYKNDDNNINPNIKVFECDNIILIVHKENSPSVE